MGRVIIFNHKIPPSAMTRPGGLARSFLNFAHAMGLRQITSRLFMKRDLSQPVNTAKERILSRQYPKRNRCPAQESVGSCAL